MFAVSHYGAFYLGSKLAGRSQHQRPRRSAVERSNRAVAQQLQHWQSKGRSLSGARLSAGKNVSTLENNGNGPCLDRRRAWITLRRNGAKEFGPQAKF